MVIPSFFLLRDHRCPVCFGTPKLTTAEFKQRIYDAVGDEYTLIGEYDGVSKNVKLKHETCGYLYKVTPTNFYKGNRCPACALKSFSAKEKQIVSFIQSFYPNEIKENIKINNVEVDIYIPDKNIAIEFDGLYWHSEQKGKKKNYHMSKTETVLESGVRLIHIFEDEWDNKREIVESKIKHILGFNSGPRVYARNCIIKEVGSKEKNVFLESNHIQGLDNSTVKLGLYKDNELMSVMTFGKRRGALGSKNNSNDDYELIRFASLKDVIVIGGFGKLLKHFMRNYTYSTIRTYADLRWSSMDDNVYKTAGFKKLHISDPNYWYFIPWKRERFHRYGFRKQVLKKKFPDYFNEQLTESEIVEGAGYYKIWDCGNLVYELKKE